MSGIVHRLSTFPKISTQDNFIPLYYIYVIYSGWKLSVSWMETFFLPFFYTELLNHIYFREIMAPPVYFKHPILLNLAECAHHLVYSHPIIFRTAEYRTVSLVIHLAFPFQFLAHVLAIEVRLSTLSTCYTKQFTISTSESNRTLKKNLIFKQKLTF